MLFLSQLRGTCKIIFEKNSKANIVEHLQSKKKPKFCQLKIDLDF